MTLSPKGTMGKFYKTIISMFIFISFLYPLTSFKANEFKTNFEFEDVYSDIVENSVDIEIENSIKGLLEENGISSAMVDVKTLVTYDEVTIEKVVVSIIDEYNCEDVGKIVFDNLGIIADVKRIGEWFERKIENLFKSKQNKTKILIIAGVVGIILILLSEISFAPDSKAAEVTSNDYVSYINNLDKELTEIISSINGVGSCEVMITLKNTTESVYAQNAEISSDGSSSSENNEYVIYNSANGDSPVLLKENFPEIEGVAVVCSGGDNVAVREQIIKCVSALFGISSNRISVSKITT